MKDEYQGRINRVLDHVDSHLDGDLDLGTLSRIAGFSPSHFHRIFAAMRGETLAAYVQRIRLERAASRLLHDPRASVTEIALDCGFSSPATFARAFKAQFSMSASEWRQGGWEDRKIGKTVRKQGEAIGGIREATDVSSTYLDPETRNLKWRIAMKKNTSSLKAEVEITDLEERTVAYVRHTGPYQGNPEVFGQMIGRLCKWAGPRGLLQSPDATMMSIYHDDPEITDADKLRVEMALTVPEETETSGEIGKTTVPGGKYAVARFELAPDQYADAWNALYGGWLPESGFQPDDRPALEIYRNDPEQHPEGKCIVDICIPVKPL